MINLHHIRREVLAYNVCIVAACTFICFVGLMVVVDVRLLRLHPVFGLGGD